MFFLWKLRVIGELWEVYESCEILWVSGVGESNVASLWGTAEGSSNGKIGPFVGDVTQLYSRNSTSNDIPCFFGGSKGNKGNRCKRFQGKHLWMMCASSMLLSSVLFEWRCRPLPKTEGLTWLNMIGFGRTERSFFHTYEPVAKGRERDHGRPANQAVFGWSCFVWSVRSSQLWLRILSLAQHDACTAVFCPRVKFKETVFSIFGLELFRKPTQGPDLECVL